MSSKLLMLSGWAQSTDSFSSLRECCPQSFELASYSPHDFGVLEERIVAKTPSSHCRALESLLREQKNEGSKLVVLGWSMGGMIALEAASYFPELIDALVLVASTARFCSSDLEDDDYPWGVRQSVVRSMKRKLQQDAEQTLRDFYGQMYSPAQIFTSVIEANIEASMKYSMPALVAGLDYLEHLDLRDRLNYVTCPVRIVHGQADMIVPSEAAFDLNSKLPNAQLRLIEQCAHAPAQTHAEIVAEEIQHLF